MINITIDNNPYKVVEQWSEMTLLKAIELSLIVNSMPPRLKAVYDLMSQGGEDLDKNIAEWSASITDEEFLKLFPLFYGKVIECLTDIPADVIEHVNRSERDVFYKNYCEKFVFGLLYFPVDYQYKSPASFTHNDIEYFLPETKNIMGVEKPFFDRTAIEFTESADLEIYSKQLEAGKWEVAANIISILCRPLVRLDVEYKMELEKYNEETCLQRAEEFKSLTMDIVFEVFFCLAKHIHLSTQRTVISSLESLVEHRKGLLKVV